MTTMGQSMMKVWGQQIAAGVPCFQVGLKCAKLT